MRWAALVSGLLAWLVPQLAHARLERYAVIVGNNQGERHEAPLAYAESDALRVYDVLRELGGFEPANMVLLRGADTNTIRRSLIAMNDRIRQATNAPDTQTMLAVYYSGHADAEALHPGSAAFDMTELVQLVRGSAASFRLVVLDACRSGALTRLKGGSIRPAFALPDERLSGQGMAFLASTSPHEDAQESDDLRGSFFTHALLSGLLGAADRDGDGEVVLDEAYRYAYESTLRATSRTFAGTQHPTFRYDFAGQGDFVLTRPERYAAERATLQFPDGMEFLLLRDDASGMVVAELATRAQNRSLSLREGRYFVRARAADVMYEGVVQAVAGTTLPVRVEGFARIEYAHLVRKGLGTRARAHGLEAGTQLRTALSNETGFCIGGFAGYGLDFEHFGMAARFGVCQSSFRTATVHASIQAYDLETRFYHAWDIAWLTLDLGLGVGAGLFQQHFDTRGIAPARATFVPFTSLRTGASGQLGSGFYASLDASTETHFLQVERRRERPQLSVEFALRTSLSIGRHF